MIVALTVFSALAALAWRGSDPHLSAYFDRRDPAACPGNRDRYDDELLGCIRRAREAQRDWMLAQAAIGNIGVLGEAYILPPMLPFFARHSCGRGQCSKRRRQSAESIQAKSIALCSRPNLGRIPDASRGPISVDSRRM